MITLKNDTLTVMVNPFGAELSSITDTSGREYIWQGDPTVWNGRSPILFPIAGRLQSDSFIYEGKQYFLQKHGFARKTAFQVADVKENEATFSLSSNEDSKRVFPFSFTLYANYKVENKILTVTDTVKNEGDATMYFSLGAHPAFNIEIGDSVVFEKSERLETHLFNDSGLAEGKKIIAENSDTVAITDHIFDDDALFFENMKSTSAKVVSVKDGPLAEIRYGKVPMLGLWAKPGASFVCVEPWLGFCDFPGVSGKIEEKPYILSLPAGETYTFSYTITILQ